MQAEALLNEASQILDRLPELKLVDALNYLHFLNDLPEEQLGVLEDFLESLGWWLLGLEAAQKQSAKA